MVRLTLEEPRFDIGNFESYFLAFAEYALADPLVFLEGEAQPTRPLGPSPRVVVDDGV